MLVHESPARCPRSGYQNGLGMLTGTFTLFLICCVAASIALPAMTLSRREASVGSIFFSLSLTFLASFLLPLAL